MFSKLQFIKNIKKETGRILLAIVLSAIVAVLFLLTGDEGAFAALRWLFVCFLLAFSLRPLLPVDKLRIFDEGFGISTGFSMGISFFITWIICAVTGLRFNSLSITIITIVIIALTVFFTSKKRGFFNYSSDNLFRMFTGFFIFAVCFLLAFWCIGFNPVVDSGTENYMDYGFMTSIFRQESARPMDFWYKGERLNYYYLGQAAAVYMTRLSFTTPEYGYNLMLCTFISVVFTASAEIAYGFVSKITKRADKKSCVISSVAAGFIAAFSSNAHWIVYGMIIPLWDRVIYGSFARAAYWFSDPTVFISTSLGDYDNGKNEFPAYSVLLGDLHAHVVDLMFTLPLVAILLDYLFTDDEEKRTRSIYRFAVMGILLALYKGVNYWDFAIFFVICGGMIVFKEFAGTGFKKEAILRILTAAAVIIVSSYVFALPFTLSFSKISSHIGIAYCHTKLYKYLVLWLFPISVAAPLADILFSKRGENLINNVKSRYGFGAFVLCALGLIITPEFIYIPDIYGGDSARFNTMFKLTYVAFALFAIIIGIAIGILFEKSHMLLFGILCFISILLCSYTPYAVKVWEGDVTDYKLRKGISAIQPLYDDEVYGFEMEIYDVLMEDDSRDLTIVECSGNSYTHEDAISVYTGAQTVGGWYVHEWLWRNNPSLINQRCIETEKFYQSGDREYCRDFVKKYDVDYIVKGPAEVCKYFGGDEGYEDLGETVISKTWQGETLKLIKVNKNQL